MRRIRFMKMAKQRIVFFVGPDMTGKTSIAKELCVRMRLPYFKASSEHKAFLGDQTTFLSDLLYADPRVVDILTQTRHSIVVDRGYPCEYAYSRFFGRKTDERMLRFIDEKYAALGAFIVYCARESFKGIVDNLDPKLDETALLKISSYYDEFASWTKCKVFKLFVDDRDLNRQVNAVIDAMKGPPKIKANKPRPYDHDFESKTYDAAYYQNHTKYYEKGISGFADFLRNNIEFCSLVDLGCGTGAFSASVQDEKDVLGIDFSVGSREVSFLKPENFLVADLTQPLDLNKRFDVVMSLEVWEHMLPDCENVYLDNVCSLDPKVLIISCAVPGQIGRHHYTPHTHSEVIDTISARGFRLNETLTEKFRKIPKLATFYRKNTFVFNKIEGDA